MYANLSYEVQRIEDQLDKALQDVEELDCQVDNLKCEKEAVETELSYAIENNEVLADQVDDLSTKLQELRREFRDYKHRYHESGAAQVKEAWAREKEVNACRIKDGEDAIKNQKNLLKSIAERDEEINELKHQLAKQQNLIDELLTKTIRGGEPPKAYLVEQFEVLNKPFGYILEIPYGHIREFVEPRRVLRQGDCPIAVKTRKKV